MNRLTIPTIIGIIILIVGVVAGVFLVQQQESFRLGASPDIAPQDLRITNINDNSFSVSWITDKLTIGLLEWGESEQLGQVAREEDTTAKYTHLITVRGLSPNKLYFFKINSAGKKFDNSGIAWQATTGASLAAPSMSEVASGTILTSTGEPAPGVIVYINSGGMSPLSAVTSTNGNWVIPISEARNTVLDSYSPVTKETLLEIFVQGGAFGVATAQAFANMANPTPNITLGQSFDFRSETTSGTGSSPEADIELPGGAAAKADDTSVTLESVDEGEVVFTASPEFFGEGPAGTKITITVESDPVTQQLTIPQSGDWNWNSPEDLPEGEHTVTISWIDVSGVLQTITRKFEVQAASDEPAFESTPSGSTSSPTPSPTPTPTATPTSSPSPTESPSPTIKPTSTPVAATGAALPKAGSVIPTYVLFAIGFVVLSGGIFISKKYS